MTRDEQAFDTGRVIDVHELEGYRRSAAMAPLSPDAVQRILDYLGRLVAEREQITAILAALPASFGAVRQTLNELQRLAG